MVQQGLETNCHSCPFRTYDGIDHLCTAHFDGFPGHAAVYPSMYKHPDWCPLEQPSRITREEIERAIPKNTKAALVMMHLKNGDKAPDHLVDEITDRTQGVEK